MCYKSPSVQNSFTAFLRIYKHKKNKNVFLFNKKGVIFNTKVLDYKSKTHSKNINQVQKTNGK